MAQREEEAELRVPETTVTLCANNCGFHGNPATKNMCQTCFQAAGPPSCSGLPRSGPVRLTDRVEGAGEVAAGPVAAMIEGQLEPAAAREVKRCAGCRKKVGLTGFRCRCGEMFCSKHRYSDRHVCSYDYKAAGREAIARENPVVRAAKIVRI